MPLVLCVMLCVVTAATAERVFNITHLLVPPTIPPGQQEVEIECRYDANFTLLNWFKGPNEFFRYKPGAAPSTRSFPIVGVGRVEMMHCGPTACRLKLGALTKDATGLYRCDIERDAPPYKFESRTAYMEVHGHEQRRPLLEGLAEQYSEGDEIQAYCRAAPNSEIRWYINGREIEDARESLALKRRNSRLLYLGIPPVMTVQCAESRYGQLSGSKKANAKWKESTTDNETPQEQRNASSALKSLGFVYLYLTSYLL